MATTTIQQRDATSPTGWRTVTIKSDAEIIGTSQTRDYWRIGTDVYSADQSGTLDTRAYPMGARWECTLAHWKASKSYDSYVSR